MPENNDQDSAGTSDWPELVQHIKLSYTTVSHVVLPLLLYKYAWWEEA